MLVDLYEELHGTNATRALAADLAEIILFGGNRIGLRNSPTANAARKTIIGIDPEWWVRGLTNHAVHLPDSKRHKQYGGESIQAPPTMANIAAVIHAEQAGSGSKEWKRWVASCHRTTSVAAEEVWLAQNRSWAGWVQWARDTGMFAVDEGSTSSLVTDPKVAEARHEIRQLLTAFASRSTHAHPALEILAEVWTAEYPIGAGLTPMLPGRLQGCNEWLCNDAYRECDARDRAGGALVAWWRSALMQGWVTSTVAAYPFTEAYDYADLWGIQMWVGKDGEQLRRTDHKGSVRKSMTVVPGWRTRINRGITDAGI